MGFPGDSDGKVSACNAGDQVQFLDREDPLEKEMVIQSSTLAWKALGITYYLHCAWRPQSSGKVERANQFDKKDNLGNLPGMEGSFTNSPPLHPYGL